MSHVADVQLQVHDLKALKAAVEEAGGVWLEGQKTHRWYGVWLDDWNSEQAAANRRDPKTFGKCEHAIRVPGVNYEIGVVKHASGVGYDLVYDAFGAGGSGGDHDGKKLEQKFGGPGLPALKQGYATQVATKDLRAKGYRITKTLDAKTGEIKIKAVK